MVLLKNLTARAVSLGAACILVVAGGVDHPGAMAQQTGRPLQIQPANPPKPEKPARAEPREQAAKPTPTPNTPDGGMPREKTFPENVSWTLVTLNKRAVSGDRPTMILDKQMRMRGFAGCNTYSATSYPLRGQRIAVGPIAFTRKKCDNALMNLERSYLVTLRGAYQWDIIGPQLLVRSADGELVFERTL
ncbi:MAG: META domain-containing protein [Methylobacteriaceae bacterium]|nr:META domain-containing protein [Methylobacteriaceae bacterium]